MNMLMASILLFSFDGRTFQDSVHLYGWSLMLALSGIVVFIRLNSDPFSCQIEQVVVMHFQGLVTHVWTLLDTHFRAVLVNHPRTLADIHGMVPEA